VDAVHVNPPVMESAPTIVDLELAADVRERRVAAVDITGDPTKTMPRRPRVQ
jgi:hypothetical protein